MKKFILIIASVLLLGGCSSNKASEKNTPPITEPNVSTNDAIAADVVANSEKIVPKTNSGNDQMYTQGSPSYPDSIDSTSEFDSLPAEQYLQIDENKDEDSSEENTITFSLKVDTSSYNNVTRYIESGNIPPSDAIKVEEMINYFKYDGQLGETDKPFSIYTEIGNSPFKPNKKTALIRIKSKDIDKQSLPKSNLTFLIDTSGSMESYDKLPLLKSAFALLVDTLTENDKVSIVTYAGSSDVVLDSVSGDQKDKILDAINNLNAGGSTAGADGIVTAYALAEKNFITDGNNRVILSTDGDFNVGLSSPKELEDLISAKRDTGVYLSILGFGTGNIKDNNMETLSKNGNGNYAYINSLQSAEKVLVDELASNLFVIANDVKSQIEFNTKLVNKYRLIGYENRALANEDFENDAKDAGEIGVGTDVVIMIEFELASESVDSDKDELFEVRIRYKEPNQKDSKLITHPVKIDNIKDINTTDFIFATSVVEYAQILRNSENKSNATYEDIINLAKDGLGKDAKGYRQQFINLVNQTKDIQN